MRPQGSTSLWPETACLQDDTISVLNLMFYCFTGHLLSVLVLSSRLAFHLAPSEHQNRMAAERAGENTQESTSGAKGFISNNHVEG